MPSSELFGIIAVMATLVGATWALRSKLSDIESMLAGHHAENLSCHDQRKIHESRLDSIEYRLDETKKTCQNPLM